LRRERGSGSIFRPKFKDTKTGKMRECPHFRISYYRHGQKFVENTHSDKITVAKLSEQSAPIAPMCHASASRSPISR